MKTKSLTYKQALQSLKSTTTKAWVQSDILTGEVKGLSPPYLASALGFIPLTEKVATALLERAPYRYERLSVVYAIHPGKGRQKLTSKVMNVRWSYVPLFGEVRPRVKVDNLSKRKALKTQDLAVT